MENEHIRRQRQGDFAGTINDSLFRFTMLITAVLAIPFTLNNFADDFVFSAFIGMAILALITISLVLSSYFSQPLLSRSVYIGLIAGGCLLVAWERGPMILYWAYPIVVVFHFLLNRRVAIVLNVVFVLAALALAFLGLTLDQLGRFVASLTMCSLFASFFSVTLSRHRDALEQQIMTDSLTGAYNRRYMDERLPRFIEQKRRYDHAASMIIIDLDFFKRVNDQWGHEAGDRVLRTVVDNVRGRIRAVDEIYRMGGDEFVVLLPGTPLAPATKLGQDIIDIIASLHIIGGGVMTLSMGVAELLPDESARSWLRRCDMALIEAKRRGRNQYCIATESPLADDSEEQAVGSAGRAHVTYLTDS